MKGVGEARGFYLESFLYKSYMSHVFYAAALSDQRTLCPADRQILHCVVFTYSIKQAREIRKLHVARVQRRQRNVQNSAMHVQICCFVNTNPLLF